MKRFIVEVMGYGAASLIALTVDFGLLWSLVNFCSWGYLPAATAAFLGGALIAYLLSIKWAFREHRLQNGRTEFAGFLAIGGFGLAVNASVMTIAVRHFGLHYIIAKCVAAGFTFTCNFVARRQLLFVRRAAA